MKSFTKPIVIALALGMTGSIGAMVSPSCAEEMADPHAHHHHMMSMTSRRTATYDIPQVDLVRQDGKAVSLPEELDDGRPVVLSFIYTTCTSVCPLISQTLSQLQHKLGNDRDKVHLVSISIDPEEDTPARLAAYARKYDAGPEWQHYTGTISSSIEAQKAFGVYRGDKMNHTPVTLLRASPGQPWVRIDGFATADDLLGEVRNMLAPAGHHGAHVSAIP